MAHNLGFGSPYDFSLTQSPLGFGQAEMPMQAPRRSWQARIFDRLSPTSDFDLSDDDKKAIVRQGFLQLASGLLQSNQFPQALGQGLQGGLLALQEGPRQLQNQRYTRQIQERTLAGARRNQRLEDLQDALAQGGGLDSPEFRQYAAYDPQGAKAYRDVLDPQQRFQLGELGTPEGGSVPVFFDPTKPGTVYDVSGRPVSFGGGMQQPIPQSAPQAQMGGGLAPQQDFAALSQQFGIQPTSVLRTPDRNAAVGGVPNSFHLTGQAADYVVPPTQKPAFIAQARQMGYQAIDEGDHVHIEPPGSPSATPPRQGLANLPGYTPPKAPAQRDTWSPLSPEEVTSAGLPAGTVAQRNNATGQIQTIRLPSAAQTTGGKALNQGTVDKLTKEADKLTTLQGLTAGFSDDYGGYKVGGDLANTVGRLTGSDQAQWWQQYDRLKNEVRNELFGASLTTGEQKAFLAADISPNQDPKTIRTNLAKQQEVIERGLKRKARTWAAQGYNREAIEAATGFPLVEEPQQNAAPARKPMPASLTREEQAELEQLRARFGRR